MKRATGGSKDVMRFYRRCMPYKAPRAVLGIESDRVESGGKGNLSRSTIMEEVDNGKKEREISCQAIKGGLELYTKSGRRRGG